MKQLTLLAEKRTRAQFASTLRMLASLIAVRVAKGKLWINRAWSRPVNQGRDLENAIRYVANNAFKGGYADLQDTFFILDGLLEAECT